MATSLLKVSGITKKFDEVQVLYGVDLQMVAGEIIGLVGENGAGKSTLMNVIAGEFPQTSGTVEFGGRTVAQSSVRSGRALGIRFVHQELSGAPSMTVAENIFLGDYGAGSSGFFRRSALNRAATGVLGRVGLSHIHPSTELGLLRTGEQQLLELAKAIADQPRLLILDEPTSSLSPVEAQRLFALTRELASAGVGIIFITHRLDEAIENCDRIVVLRDGRLISDRGAQDTTKAQLIVDMIGRTTSFEYRPPAGISDRIRLKVSGLSDRTHLSAIDLNVAEGEIVGLFGLVGAGRTEFLETLYGYRPAASGSVEIDGVPLKLGDVTRAVKQGLFMLPEGRKTRGILPTHSVRSNISISRLRGLSRSGFVNRPRESEEAASMASVLGIRMANIAQPITSLSGGNQQKALFARGLLAMPKVLLLDEPTHGVDVGAKAEIYEIIRSFVQGGAGVILASSELPEILAIADRCIVFAGGRITAHLSRDEMTEESILSHAFQQSTDGAARRDPRPIPPPGNARSLPSPSPQRDH